jgi:hypothetical protein
MEIDKFLNPKNQNLFGRVIDDSKKKLGNVSSRVPSPGPIKRQIQN